MRHNQKNQNKIIALEDQFVLKNLIQGSTICYNCLGELYAGIINLDSSDRYNNLILINNLEFKYKTVDEINSWVNTIASKLLLPNGRIIMSVDHKFLLYNRVGIAVNTLVDTWFSKWTDFKVVKSLALLSKTTPGYGDYFFCLDYA
jgi:hypothetical protein